VPIVNWEADVEWEEGVYWEGLVYSATVNLSFQGARPEVAFSEGSPSATFQGATPEVTFSSTDSGV